MSEATIWFGKLTGKAKQEQEELLKMNKAMHGLTLSQALQRIYEEAIENEKMAFFKDA